MKENDRIGPYTITGVLSTAGGFADIYLAKREGQDAPVALKVLREKADEVAVGLFHNEARVLQDLEQLHHPHIVRWVDSGSDGGHHYFAMEKLGTDVYSTLKAKPMPFEEATRLTVQVCEALIPVHAKGVVHHDVHVHNMLHDAVGNIKLADFGIAYSPGERPPGRPLGMQKYMSPEQVKGERSDPRSDQYSLGLTYFLLLTSRPFVRHQTELAPDPNTVGTSGAPGACVEVIRRMLSKEPAQRFESIEHVRDVLKGLMLKA